MDVALERAELAWPPGETPKGSDRSSCCWSTRTSMLPPRMCRRPSTTAVLGFSMPTRYIAITAAVAVESA